MQSRRPRPAGKTLGIAALAASVLFAGTACGSGEAATRQASPVASGTTVQASPPGRALVQKELRRLEASYKARVGAFILDTGTGTSIGHRVNETFPTASTFKAMAAAAVLDRARRSDPGLLDRTVHWKKSDEMPNSPLTQGRGEKGMKVAEISRAAITHSDNTAGNLLLKQIGGPAGLTRFYRSIGDRVTRSDRWEPALNEWKPGEKRDVTTPAAMGRNLQNLVLGKALVSQDRERLAGWMRATVTGDNRIRAGVPKGWKVGDKTGTGGRYAPANDIAVAWPPSGAPVVIVVYTTRRDPDAKVEEKLIASTTEVLVRGLGKGA
ncbi:class A beta-lactamase [Actinomadura hibisca]|uniref:class A beta-lactamase n=1 Tax=Actinomadura hibisca TaxID=68565 RepID=UPI0009FEA9E8|nr:class A beta-lactamase [Actinomadura hibisca]